MTTQTYTDAGVGTGLGRSTQSRADLDGHGLDEVSMARALGWASLAIGGLEIAATRPLENLMGLQTHHGGLFKSLGAREMAAGAAILSQQEATPALAAGLWSRVAGDAMDLALLLGAFRTTRRPAALGFVTAMVAGITLLDIACAQRLSRA